MRGNTDETSGGKRGGSHSMRGNTDETSGGKREEDLTACEEHRRDIGGEERRDSGQLT